MKTEAETKGMWPQAKGLLGPREGAETGKDLPLEPSGGHGSADTLISDSGLQRAHVFAGLSLPVCRAVLQQPQERIQPPIGSTALPVP